MALYWKSILLPLAEGPHHGTMKQVGESGHTSLRSGFKDQHHRIFGLPANIVCIAGQKVESAGKKGWDTFSTYLIRQKKQVVLKHALYLEPMPRKSRHIAHAKKQATVGRLAERIDISEQANPRVQINANGPVPKEFDLRIKIWMKSGEK